MNEIKAVLRPLRDASGRLVPHIYESIHGGLEPLFVRSVERGEVQFGHQSGYLYLPESRVEVLDEQLSDDLCDAYGVSRGSTRSDVHE